MYDTKWGRFKPEPKFNVVQSPCPFVLNNKKTYRVPEENENQDNGSKVWISVWTRDNALCKCASALCVPQSKLAFVFRGKGNVSDDERNAWHPDVHV